MLRLSYLAHILAAGAWVGALLPVLLVMRQMAKRVTQEQAIPLRNFSITGHYAVALTVVSGLVNATPIRGRFFPSTSSSYDAMLILKIAIVAAMISIAAVNRYVIVPRLANNPRSATTLLGFTGTEFVLAGIVIIVVNQLSALNPH